MAAFGILGVGCQPSPPRPTATATPTPTPQPKSTPVLQANASGVANTLFDANGKKVFEVIADQAGVVPIGGTRTATATGGTVILYQKGEARAKLRASSVSTDEKTRVVTASGGVMVQSLDGQNAPMARADTITWQYDQDTIEGSGNVLITNGPGWEFPAKSFKGNTELRDIEFKSDGRPATGQF